MVCMKCQSHRMRRIQREGFLRVAMPVPTMRISGPNVRAGNEA